MKSMLSRNQEADEKILGEIDNVFKEARQATHEPGSYEDAHVDDYWLDLVHNGAYQSAAHNLAAAAMLAPFVETLFVRIFRYIGDETQPTPQADCGEKRRQASEEQFWDPHWFFQPKKARIDLPDGIKQLADYTGLKRFLPDDYDQTLGALFCYRNKIFHNGLEWPKEECEKFKKTVQENKWQDWFIEDNLSQDSQTFTMQAEFIDHCLTTIDGVIDGFGEYVRNSEEHSQKRPASK